MLSTSFIICLNWGLVDADVLGRNDIPNLKKARQYSFSRKVKKNELPHTLCLNVKRSFCVSVSAFAITGIKLTRVPRRFMISISSGLSLVCDPQLRAKCLHRSREPLTCGQWLG